ncbi:MAG: GxxExxY protein [Bacteroidaceae bacterium]|nr:GxxExxY protein [Bacteroidaceae bacterium]
MYLYQELTGKIVNACYKVHNELGCGFLEKVYQEAVAIVLQEEGIPFEREKHLQIKFHGNTLGCDYIADFVVEGKVILELKAVQEMLPVFQSQVINYLKVTGMQVGLLINFGQSSLQVKRLAANIY